MKDYCKIVNKEKLNIIIDNNNYSFPLDKLSKTILNASDKERNTFEISPSGYGIYWALIDEDISIDGLLGVVHSPNHHLMNTR